MSKARILADLMSDSQITASEITGLELNAIQEGDTVVEVVDNGAGGKVVVRVDGADNAEFNSGSMVVPSGTTAERDPNPTLGTLRYNTTIGFFETFTAAGWGSIATPPTISNITPVSFDGLAGQQFTIDGAFFDTATTATFSGNDGTAYGAGTITFVSASRIIITNATNLPVNNEPYVVTVVNGAGLSVSSSMTIDAGSSPTWNTASGNLVTTTQWNNPISVTVSASDADTSISGYTLTQGNLPPNLTLDSTTGVISGTSSEQTTTTYNFTIEATDTAGNTSARQFNIQIVNAAPTVTSPAENEEITFNPNQSNTYNIVANDPEGSSLTYTHSSGTFPSGLSLSGATITGQSADNATFSSIGLTVSDGYQSAVRNFYIRSSIIPADTAALVSAGATQVSTGVYRITAGGLYTNIDFGTESFTVHVIGAGGWSGVDGMGYGNCGGGGGGGGAFATFSNVGVVNFQVGAAITGHNYTAGQDGAQTEQWAYDNKSPGADQKSWFINATTIFGNGGGPGWYNGRASNTVNGVRSGAGGTYGGTQSGLVGSNGGIGGDAVWNAQSSPGSGELNPTNSAYGGGGGGRGNDSSGGYGASGALSGTGGRGGVPNGAQTTLRQNTIGTLGGGNGGQAKWLPDNNTGPFAIIPSSHGVIQFDFN